MSKVQKQPGEQWPSGKENTANVLRERRQLSEPMSGDEADRNMFRRSRRGFLVGGAAALAGIFGWRWLDEAARESLTRKFFGLNEKISQTFIGSDDLAPEFPRELASARVNGDLGLKSEFSIEEWRLNVFGVPSSTKYARYAAELPFAAIGDDPPVTKAGLAFPMDHIRSLPRMEMTTEFKCIEGWSVIMNWTGVRFSDLAAGLFPGLEVGEIPDLHNLPSGIPKYVSLVTPDREYYVGWDIESIMHPQTMLAYEMNGAPLRPEHGAPLRLMSTTKYGIKMLKRIGRIEFTNDRPRDYWAENGYDWYAGL